MKNVVKGLLIATAVFAFGSGAIEARPAGTLHYGTRIQLNNWNPLVKPNQTYTGIVYEGLVKVAPDGHTIQPSLATAWTLNTDKLELTLRPGVVFHDGTPFDANVAKQNIEWIKKSGTQWSRGFAEISSIDVKDATHLTLHLTTPSPTMLQRLASRGAYMVSPKVIASGSWSKEGGTGPWVYDAAASQLGTREVFRYFDRYWAPDNVGVGTIVMHVLQDPSVQLNALVSGLVQVTELDSSQIPAAEAAGMKSKSSPSLIQHILFLDRRQTFANENVRKAICSAADIAAIGKAAYNGYAKPVSQKVREGLPGYNPDVKGYTHDLAAAKKYMAAAGNPKSVVHAADVCQQPDGNDAACRTVEADRHRREAAAHDVRPVLQLLSVRQIPDAAQLERHRGSRAARLLCFPLRAEGRWQSVPCRGAGTRRARQQSAEGNGPGGAEQGLAGRDKVH